MTTDDPTPGAGDTGDAASRPVSPSAAAAARRARRIGGRTAPRAAGRPADRPSPSPSPAPGPAAAPVEKAEDTGNAGNARNTRNGDDAAGTGAAKPAARSAATPAPPAATADTTTRLTKRPAGTSRRSAKEQPTADAEGPVVVTQVPTWLLWLPAAALAVVAVVFAVVIAVTAHGVWYAKPATNAVRDQVLAAAKTCVAATNSYKWNTIAADERNGLTCTTGAWATNYRNAMDKILIPSSKTLKTTQTTSITTAGVQSVQSHGRVWKVLVFGQASVTSINQKTPRPDPFSAVVTMQKSGGKWKVADIDQVLKPIKASGG